MQSIKYLVLADGLSFDAVDHFPLRLKTRSARLVANAASLRETFPPETFCLEHIEGTASDGTRYQMEFDVFWDDKPNGAVRVFGDLSLHPQKPLLGSIPICTPDVNDSFIMSPDGNFVGEKEDF